METVVDTRNGKEYEVVNGEIIRDGKYYKVDELLKLGKVKAKETAPNESADGESSAQAERERRGQAAYEEMNREIAAAKKNVLNEEGRNMLTGALETTIGSLAPITDGLNKSTYALARSKGIPEAAATILGGAVGAAGLPLDIASFVTSPVKKGFTMASQKAFQVLPNKLSQAAERVSDAIGKNVAGMGAKGAAANTGDALIFNSLERLANGEEITAGERELISGLLGGAAGTPAMKKAYSEMQKIRKYAAKNNANVNFAERNTDKFDREAIEEIIKKNKRPEESFDDAVVRLRGEGDALNKEFYAHMQKEVDLGKGMKLKIEDMNLNKTPTELRNDIVNYSMKKTRHLGHDFEKEMLNEIDGAFGNYLRTIKELRMEKANPNTTPEEIFNKVEEIPYEELVKDLKYLTLGELDYIKRGMQSRTSHYSRGKGTMERQGLESRANKEGSEGILDILGDYADDETRKLSKDIGEFLGELEFIDPAAVKKYMELNKKRAYNIGATKIMKDADAKYEDLNATANALLPAVAKSGRTPPLVRSGSSIFLSDEEDRRKQKLSDLLGKTFPQKVE